MVESVRLARFVHLSPAGRGEFPLLLQINLISSSVRLTLHKRLTGLGDHRRQRHHGISVMAGRQMGVSDIA